MTGTADHADGPVRSPRRRRWRGIALGCVILLCGAAMGAAGMRLFVVRQQQPWGGPPERGKMAEHITERLRNELGLSDEQARSVLEIFTKSEAEMEGIRQKIQPEIEANFEKTSEQIKAVLTPEQVRLWEAHVAQMRNHPGGPPPDMDDRRVPHERGDDHGPEPPQGPGFHPQPGGGDLPDRGAGPPERGRAY